MPFLNMICCFRADNDIEILTTFALAKQHFMSYNRFLLVDEEFLKQVLEKLEKLRYLMESYSENTRKKNSAKLMDTADAMAYFKVTRKTLYKYRMNGLPYMQVENGKIYYNPEEVDQYIKSQRR